MIPKYRVWDKELQTMLDVSLIDFKKGVLVGEHWEFGETNFMNFDEIVLMQSTGLKDKNGKEIFEGDVVKRYRSPFFKAKWEYQIETVIKEKASLLLGREFGKNFGTIPFDSPFAESVLLEVIGNIYENPELLEEKE
nr:MAG TPA: YopX protein [Caudoviricetes sp.]